MNREKEIYECIMCGKRITKEEYETLDGLCQECYEIEIADMDYEDEEYQA